MNNTRYPGAKVLADVHIPDVQTFSGIGGTLKVDPHVSNYVARIGDATPNVQLQSQRVRLGQLNSQLASWRAAARAKIGR